jgi:UDP-N-acetylglucosamine 4,6-dehydratase
MTIKPQAPAALRDFGSDASVFDGRSVLITGATGSFGRRFVRRILDGASPRRLIVFSRDELKQWEMTEEFATHPKRETLRFFIGDVRDLGRLEMALRGVDYVVHAAAMKQVPTAEYNPFECINTNVLGAENVVQACLRTGVRKVVALSTDKAANPINLYGASKLASDKIFVAANNMAGDDGARFSVVRYGNVIGSRGSVVPLFQRLLCEGVDALPITDPKMTRFWITLDQGVDFVFSCIKSMIGGEVFVPKIPSMTILDLALALAPDLPQRIVGIRPGEKLHEVMITEDDARNTVELADRYVIEPTMIFRDWKKTSASRGKSVAENFRYASDNNGEWLKPADLRRILGMSVA